MEKRITFVGMDAHKVAIKLAVLVPGETKPVEWQWRTRRRRCDGW